VAPVVHVTHDEAFAPHAALSPMQLPAALHLPAESQASMPLVHALPLFAGVFTHAPLTHALVLQASPVQTIGLPLHWPAEHASAVVQGSPSSQEPAASVCWQPFTASQVSVVQGLLSSQSVGTSWHWFVPELQVFVLHESFTGEHCGTAWHLPLKQDPVAQATVVVHAVPFVWNPYWHLVPLRQTVPVCCWHGPGLSHATAQHAPPTQWPSAHSLSFWHADRSTFRQVPETFV
jgi:hypothetical protein